MDKFVAEPKSKFQENEVIFTQFLEGELDFEMKKTTLYDYQIHAVLATREYFKNNGTKAQPALIVAPTGSGKSGILTMLPYVLGSAKVLVLTPSVVITKQLAVCFGLSSDVKQSFFHKTKIFQDIVKLRNFLENGKVIHSSKEIDNMSLANLVIVNAQKFGGASSTSLVTGDIEVVKNVKETFERFSTIIVDEAHHYPARTWYKIVENFKNKQIVFLTATPYRRGDPILGYDQVITYEIDKTLIVGRTIRHCEFESRTLVLPEKGLGEAEFKKIGEDIKSVLFEHDVIEPSVKHKAMVLVFLTDEAENAARFIDKATYCTSDRRTDANLEEFNKNDDSYTILFVCGRLCEGYDNSNISVCVILRKVRSMILFTQFVGRCLRTSFKGDCVSALVLSYSAYEQRQMWNHYNPLQIAENDPEEEQEYDNLAVQLNRL